MHNGGNSLGVVAAIYEECTFLCHNFSRVIFSHSPKEANRATHNLAKFTEGNNQWLDDPPDFVQAALENDISLNPDQ